MKVSVLMITYNHAQYLAQALESALSQKTGIDFEIVIGEDCSSDGTSELAAKYAAAYPQKIRLLAAPENHGMHANLRRTWQACRGEYVAFLEGDDFWTSSTKLQQQVDFLDANPQCSLCFHKATALQPDGSKCDFPEDVKSLSGTVDILERNFIPTASVMLRNNQIGELPAWVRQLAMSDWAMWTLYSAKGQLGFINDTMATYRIHLGGVWSQLPPTTQAANEIQFLRHIDRELSYQYHQQISGRLYNQHYRLARAYWELGQYAKARHYAWGCLRECRFPGRLAAIARLFALVSWPAGARIAMPMWRQLRGTAGWLAQKARD